MIVSRGSKPWDTCYDIEIKMMYQNSLLMPPPSMSPLCFALLKEMLEFDPSKRLSMAQVKQHQWVQKNIGKVKIQISYPRVPTPLGTERKRRASTMKNLAIPEKKKRGSENNPVLSNINVSKTPRPYKHRKSVIPSATKLPRLDQYILQY